MRARTTWLHSGDPTFDLSRLDDVSRWDYYISSYTTIKPTEGVRQELVTFPFLQRGIKRRREEFEGDLEDILLTVENEDRLVIRIGVDDYKARFERQSNHSMIHTKANRTGGQEGINELNEEARARDEAVNDKIIMNNAWMKDLSRDDVDQKKQAFEEQKRKKVKTGEAGDAPTADTAMTEA